MESFQQQHFEEMEALKTQFDKEMEDLKGNWDKDSKQMKEEWNSWFEEELQAAASFEEKLDEQIRQMKLSAEPRSQRQSAKSEQSAASSNGSANNRSTSGPTAFEQFQQQQAQREKDFGERQKRWEQEYDKAQEDLKEEARRKTREKLHGSKSKPANDYLDRLRKARQGTSSITSPLMDEHDKKWFAFEKKAAETPLIQESDIPFIDVELLSKGNLHRWFGNVLLDDRKVLTRRLMLRWHPDRFMQKFGHKLSAESLTETSEVGILAQVTKISQTLNHTYNELC
eukprot:CAMPEP_0114282754 /NCGR_PEP_ID=MMETSP0059-20121206/3727_1 /TAXON_ID=36894 /ORGANISM="Pyramimonas parkeae, Strain CCMP726" /LENGTH=283 /DNA_ID=CAMNT_0001403417 /DNA_START=96 /DNA_END=947 /DNA_ORIENTATION=-